MMGHEVILLNLATIFSLAFGKAVKPADQDPTFHLECPTGHGIEVKGVYWGNEKQGCDPKANFDEHTNLVRSSCDNRLRCDVPVAFQMFGLNFPNSTCLWASLELDIDYQCNSGIESANEDDGGTVTIKCPAGTGTKIIKAYYGRDIHYCPSIPGATEKISSLCNRKSICTLQAKEVFGDSTCTPIIGRSLSDEGKPQLDVSFKCKKMVKKGKSKLSTK